MELQAPIFSSLTPAKYDLSPATNLTDEQTARVMEIAGFKPADYSYGYAMSEVESVELCGMTRDGTLCLYVEVTRIPITPEIDVLPDGSIREENTKYPAWNSSFDEFVADAVAGEAERQYERRMEGGY